jgi:hypothetical protein
MRITIVAFLLVISIVGRAQKPGEKGIRIVDSMTVQERISRNPVLLRSEMDSLVKAHAAPFIPQQIIFPVEQKNNGKETAILFLVGGMLLLSIGIFYLTYKNHQHSISVLQSAEAFSNTKSKIERHRPKHGLMALESKIEELNGEVHKLSRENEGLNRVIKEYNGIQHEYDSIKHGMQSAYKIKNYPGYDKNKEEVTAMQGVLMTEKALAHYAYEKFLRPVLKIADDNKNNPARMSDNDRLKLMDMLVSLSFLYIEYLYLRVGDLSIGGSMVARLKDLAAGKSPDPALLKKLNMENGNRALVIKMALNRLSIDKLSYPVFDETHLNP